MTQDASVGLVAAGHHCAKSPAKSATTDRFGEAVSVVGQDPTGVLEGPHRRGRDKRIPARGVSFVKERCLHSGWPGAHVDFTREFGHRPAEPP